MPSLHSRRSVLRGSVTVGIAALGGCLFGLGGGPEAGSLVITNDHDERHTVTVTVTKTSEDEDDIRRDSQTPSPETTPIWKHEATFTVGPGEKVKEEDFVTEPGAFYVEARLETGEKASDWLRLSEAVGGGVTADAIFVDIYERGTVNIMTLHQD